MLVYSSCSLFKKVIFGMNTFTVYLHGGRTMALSGYNMIDACHRSPEAVNYKDVQGYKEGESNRFIRFAG
jgi:hypothetical protein